MNPTPRHSYKLKWALSSVLFIIVVGAVMWHVGSLRERASVAAATSTAAQSMLQPATKTNDAISGKQPLENNQPKTSSNAASITKQAKAEPLEASPVGGKTPEVCGLTKAEVEAYMASNSFSASNTSNQPTLALSEVTRKLIQSEKLQDQALGLYVMTHLAGWDAMESERLNYPGCKHPDDCASKPFEALQRARSANAEPLVKLALANNDANVYAAALYACLGAKTGACGKLSYARWAQMEPDNAAAWLSAASEAESRKDSAARIAALQRAADAKSYNSRLPQLAEVVQSDSVQAQPPLTLTTVYATLFSAGAASSIGMLSSAASYCGRKEIMDEARIALCDALATKIADKDETLVAAMIAKSIGERIGWSAERLQLYKDEYAVATGQIFEGFDDENMLSCEAITKSNQRLLRTLQVGERAAARETVEKSGKTLAEAAAEYRKRRPESVK